MLSWKTDTPANAYVIGLKELPENDDSPLSHTHIFFAHCYKNQAGWREILNRFGAGGGTILDLEFLNDERGACGGRESLESSGIAPLFFAHSRLFQFHLSRSPRRRFWLSCGLCRRRDRARCMVPAAD